MLTFLQIVNDMKELVDVKDFVNNKLGMSDRELQTVTWPGTPLLGCNSAGLSAGN